MLPAAGPDPNLLIAALPGAAFERLALHLERVSLPLGEVLYPPGRQLQHAYLLTSAIVSLHCVTGEGASAESAGVGSEGVVGMRCSWRATPGSAVARAT